MNRTLREMILCALDDAGGQAYVAEQARENPTGIEVGSTSNAFRGS
jgi:hypothetical protein